MNEGFEKSVTEEKIVKKVKPSIATIVQVRLSNFSYTDLQLDNKEINIYWWLSLPIIVAIFLIDSFYMDAVCYILLAARYLIFPYKRISTITAAIVFIVCNTSNVGGILNDISGFIDLDHVIENAKGELNYKINEIMNGK